MDRSNRFSSAHRLIKKNEFDNVFAKSHKIHYPGFCLHVKRNQRGEPRLGLAVSRKVSGKATTRNRIKRIVRESFRQNKNSIGCFDVVFVGKQKLPSFDSQALFADLLAAWTKLGRECVN